MISPKSVELLREMSNTPYGKAIEEFVADKEKNIGSVKNAVSWEDTLGRKHALKVLDEILYYMGKKQPQEKGKNQYV